MHECEARRLAANGTLRFSAVAPWLATATAVAIAVVGWWPRLVEIGSAASDAGGLEQWQARRERAELLRSPGVEHWAWGGGSARDAGDVVWDPRAQRGYLRLQGYVPNDPARFQYQAWIFDAGRDDRYPVSGGVFDVPPGVEELVVPIRADIPVERAAAFAVTVERPGGTVVSDRAKLVAVAHSVD